MSSKKLIYLFLIIGSGVGGWIPTLWGAGSLSMQTFAGSMVGAALGLWVGYTAGQALGG